MMMRQPHSCQVRRNFLSGINVEFKQSPHQKSLRAQLHWFQVNTNTRRCSQSRSAASFYTSTFTGLLYLQVDNQIPGGIFPIIFHPVPPPKSIALDSGES